MPRPPAGVCVQPGCPNLNPCPLHKRKAWAGSTRRKRLPRDWDGRRRYILRRDRGLCQLKYPGCTTIATEVDHIERGDDHRFSNLQGACSPCHAKKTIAERRGGWGVTPAGG